MTEDFIVKALLSGEGDMVRNVISKSTIVYFGIVKKVLAEGVVQVSPAVVTDEEDYFECACVLANTASASCSINITAQEGDKVLVISPKAYQNKMFQIDKKETIVNEEAQGYTQFTGIAFLVNQFQKNDYKNYIKVDKGVVEAKLAEGKGEFKLDENGTVEYKNEKASISIKDSGEFELKNDNITVSIGAEGNVEIQTKGKFTFKNDTTDLKTILSDLVNIIKALQTYGSPASHTVMPTCQTQLQNWVTSEMQQLLV